MQDKTELKAQNQKIITLNLKKKKKTFAQNLLISFLFLYYYNYY